MNRSRMRFPLPSRIRQRLLSVLALLSMVYAAPALAQSVPQSATLPTGLDIGGTSFFDGFTSTKPGWAAIQYLRR